MASYLFSEIEGAATALTAEGWHKPGSLTKASGAWIHAAGTAAFSAGSYPITSHEQWVWFAVEAGEVTLHWQSNDLKLQAEDTCFLPAGDTHIIYPGKGEPWLSIRLEAQRESAEEYELLCELAKTDKAKADELCENVFRSFKDVEYDVAKFTSNKKALLEALS